MTTIIDRLFDRTIVRDNGCWEWTGSRFYNKDYGQIKYRGKNWLTHRLAYTLCKGAIPEGLCVLHKCDNPPCINFDHMFLGTQQDNKDDCVSKDRHAYGNKIGISRLNIEQVREIRRLLAEDVPYRKIAKQYNVGSTTIYNIKIERTWMNESCQ